MLTPGAAGAARRQISAQQGCGAREERSPPGIAARSATTMLAALAGWQGATGAAMTRAAKTGAAIVEITAARPKASRRRRARRKVALMPAE